MIDAIFIIVEFLRTMEWHGKIVTHCLKNFVKMEFCFLISFLMGPLLWGSFKRRIALLLLPKNLHWRVEWSNPLCKIQLLKTVADCYLHLVSDKNLFTSVTYHPKKASHNDVLYASASTKMKDVEVKTLSSHKNDVQSVADGVTVSVGVSKLDYTRVTFSRSRSQSQWNLLLWPVFVPTVSACCASGLWQLQQTEPQCTGHVIFLTLVFHKVM